jgi:aminopeptidase N
MGNVVIEFMLKKLPENNLKSWLFVDYRGKQINSVKVNGVYLEGEASYCNERIHIPASMAKLGRNYVEVYFESEYVSDCYGVHRYRDKEDGERYIYTNLEPANCHKWFPCFDQPDLKAKYKLLVGAPSSWRIISTCSEKSITQEIDPETKADYRLNSRKVK